MIKPHDLSTSSTIAPTTLNNFLKLYHEISIAESRGESNLLKSISIIIMTLGKH